MGVVTVIGAGSGENPASYTILDAQKGGRTLSINDGVTTSLFRLLITGGQIGGSGGGGFYVRGWRFQGTALNVANSVATTYSGGGCAITNGAKATIANSLITRNRATSTPGPTLGGGIMLGSAELTATRTEVSFNSTPDGGGGFAVYGSTGILTLDSATRIVDNTTGSTGGGGILLTNGGKVNLNGATLDRNTPDNVRTN